MTFKKNRKPIRYKIKKYIYNLIIRRSKGLIAY